MTRILSVFMIVCGTAWSQSAPAFDVASIKLAAPDSQLSETFWDPGQLVARGVTLKQLIEWAYSMTETQISGGPGWLDSDRFDLEAKAGGTHTKEELLRMLQPLLKERFGLTVHRESKRMQVYALALENKSANLRIAQPGRPTGIRLAPGENFSLQITGQSVSMTYLVDYLTGSAGRLVLDRTGLRETFDFHIESVLDAGDIGGEEAAVKSAFRNSLPQLGLSLKSQTESVEALVVDRAEKPSAN